MKSEEESFQNKGRIKKISAELKGLVYLNSRPVKSSVIYSIDGRTRGMFSSAIDGLIHKKLETKVYCFSN